MKSLKIIINKSINIVLIHTQSTLYLISNIRTLYIYWWPECVCRVSALLARAALSPGDHTGAGRRGNSPSGCSWSPAANSQSELGTRLSTNHSSPGLTMAARSPGAQLASGRAWKSPSGWRLSSLLTTCD